MYYLYGVFTVSLAVLFALGVAERLRHQRDLAQIPVRTGPTCW